VLHDVFVYAQPNAQGYFIEYDSCTPSADFIPLIQFLKQFVLRAKVKIRDVSDQYGVWAAWGSERESHWETKRRWRWAERSNIAEPQWDLDSTNGSSPWGSGDLVLQDRRGVGMGHRLLVKRGEQRLYPRSSQIGIIK
jgi:folate-binding Fe-S cluster repair protein YgfZ